MDSFFFFLFPPSPMAPQTAVWAGDKRTWKGVLFKYIFLLYHWNLFLFFCWMMRATIWRFVRINRETGHREQHIYRREKGTIHFPACIAYCYVMALEVLVPIIAHLFFFFFFFFSATFRTDRTLWLKASTASRKQRSILHPCGWLLSFRRTPKGERDRERTGDKWACRKVKRVFSPYPFK